MAMRACLKCLENDWRFEKLDTGDVQATCNNCGHEFQWTPWKEPKKKRSSYSSYRKKPAAGDTEIKEFDNKDIHPMIHMAAKLRRDHPERWIRIKKKKCPQCEGTLMERDGRYGNFYGCSNYPRCKYTEKI